MDSAPSPATGRVTLIDRVAGRVGRRFATASTDRVPKGSMVELPGRGATFVTDTGDPDGPVILLMHSVMTTGLLTWYPALAELGRHFRVITLDQRWHGRGIRSESFDLRDCADDGVALADVLGVERFIAAGFSMGGGIAQLTWRRHPGRVAGLVLAATGPYFGTKTSGHRLADGVTRLMMRHVVERIPAVSPDDLDTRGLPDGAWALRQVRAGRLSRMDEISDGLTRFDSRDWLAEISAPTAVCVTDDDKVVPVTRQQLLVDGIPGATRIDVHAGHACCVMAPHEFVPAFVRACRRVAGAAHPGALT